MHANLKSFQINPSLPSLNVFFELQSMFFKNYVITLTWFNGILNIFPSVGSAASFEELHEVDRWTFRSWDLFVVFFWFHYNPFTRDCLWLNTVSDCAKFFLFRNYKNIVWNLRECPTQFSTTSDPWMMLGGVSKEWNVIRQVMEVQWTH